MKESIQSRFLKSKYCDIIVGEILKDRGFFSRVDNYEGSSPDTKSSVDAIGYTKDNFSSGLLIHSYFRNNSASSFKIRYKRYGNIDTEYFNMCKYINNKKKGIGVDTIVQSFWKTKFKDIIDDEFIKYDYKYQAIKNWYDNNKDVVFNDFLSGLAFTDTEYFMQSYINGLTSLFTMGGNSLFLELNWYKMIDNDIKVSIVYDNKKKFITNKKYKKHIICQEYLAV